MLKNSPHDKKTLDYLFPARAVAIIGVSTNPKKQLSGTEFMKALLGMGYQGKIYPVNPTGGEILGRKIYTSVREIPGAVDYAISAIPAKHNLQLLQDCDAKGVKVLHVYSAGFSEIANPEGRKLEEKLSALSRQTGVRVIGPNCMGIYSPGYGLSFRRDLPVESGSVGFISQSGSNSFQIIRDGSAKGIYLNKLFSYGNAADLNECDFLEFLARDRETKVIAGYLEGVKDGPLFQKTLTRVTKQKPVVIYKAGNTSKGIQAVASHTGTMAGSEMVWRAALRQSGALQVNSMEELVDLLSLFNYMKPPKGINTALIGIGGGVIVQATDECARGGLKLPTLPLEIRNKLEKAYTTEAGGSFRNPVDLYIGKGELIQSTIKMIADLKQIDLLMIQIMFGFGNRDESSMLTPYIDALINLGKGLNHRAAIVFRPTGTFRFSKYTAEAHQALVAAGYPIFDSAQRAAMSITKYYNYFQKK
ncbi:CoA-binding protein [Chloroflexota bacterium]